MIGGFGLGALIFGSIYTALVNPDNIDPIMAADKNKYFEVNVSDNVPFTFRIIALI